MMPHEDQSQDADMIKNVLQKIIDEMNGLEANRIMPEERKGLFAGSEGIPNPNENSAETLDQAEPENQDNQHEPLDPKILAELMDKAGSADESGALPEDNEEGLPEDIMVAVKKKKGLLK